MRFLHSIKVRITLWYLLMVAALVALFGALGYFMLMDGLSRNVVTPFDMRVADITTLQDGTGRVAGFTSVTGQIGADTGYNGVQIPVYRLLESASEDGTIEIKAMGGKPILIDRDLLTASDTAGQRPAWLYLFVSRDDPTDRKLVVAAQSEVGLASIVGLFKQTMLLSAIITLFVAGILGFFLVRRMLRPLQAITQAARDAGVSGPSAALLRRGSGQAGTGLKGSLDVGRKDELGQLATAMNQMFDRVEKAIDAERQVASDLSHELRMPLAIAQAQASLALTKGRSDKEYQKALETVSREITHLSSVTNRLLFLARSENGGGLVKSEVNLIDLLGEIASDAEGLCEAKGTTFQHDMSDKSDRSDGCLISGDPVRLRELFINLIDNAIRYTPACGTINLSLDLQSSQAVVAVSDTGAGIAPEHLPHLFERFYRAGNLSSEGGGTGLGLAICKRIAELHGGRIEVASKVGVGSTFTVFLPLATGTA